MWCHIQGGKFREGIYPYDEQIKMLELNGWLELESLRVKSVHNRGVAVLNFLRWDICTVLYEYPTDLSFQRSLVT